MIPDLHHEWYHSLQVRTSHNNQKSLSFIVHVQNLFPSQMHSLPIGFEMRKQLHYRTERDFRIPNCSAPIREATVLS